VKAASPAALRPADAVPEAGQLPVRRGLAGAAAVVDAEEAASEAVEASPKEVAYLTRLLLPAYFPLVVLLLWLAALVALLHWSVSWLPPAAVQMVASATTAPLRFLKII
jgi:hypothetical protein